jgi:type III secretory pathway component EscV
MAIICIAKNKVITGGEKALWIVGFIIFGFVTGIVFLVLAKGRKLVAQEEQADIAV